MLEFTEFKFLWAKFRQSFGWSSVHFLVSHPFASISAWPKSQNFWHLTGCLFGHSFPSNLFGHLFILKAEQMFILSVLILSSFEVSTFSTSFFVSSYGFSVFFFSSSGGFVNRPMRSAKLSQIRSLLNFFSKAFAPLVWQNLTISLSLGFCFSRVKKIGFDSWSTVPAQAFLDAVIIFRKIKNLNFHIFQFFSCCCWFRHN